MVRGVQETARSAGHSLILCNSNEDVEEERRHLRMLLSRRVDGVLLACTEPLTAMDRSIRERCPLGLVDRMPAQGFKGEAVVAHNAGAAYDATRHLIGLGHELIAIITGRLVLSPGYERAEGYRKAMQEAHLPLRGEYFKHGSFRWEMGYRYALELLGEVTPLHGHPLRKLCYDRRLAEGARGFKSPMSRGGQCGGLRRF